MIATLRPFPSHSLTPLEIERCNVIAVEIEQAHVYDHRVSLMPVHEAAMRTHLQKKRIFTCASDVRRMLSRDVRFLLHGFAGYVGYSAQQIAWHNAQRRAGK